MKKIHILLPVDMCTAHSNFDENQNTNQQKIDHNICHVFLMFLAVLYAFALKLFR